MIFSTEVIAISPISGELLKYVGPNINAISKKLAREYCENNGLGYLHISDEVVCEIPTKKDGSPDWDNMIDYETINNN